MHRTTSSHSPHRVAPLCAHARGFVGLGVLLVLSGCATLPTIKLPANPLGGGPVAVSAPADVGKPATVGTATERAGLKIPAGSRVVVTETAPTPATESAPAQPATRVTEVVVTADTELVQQRQTVQASTGTIDTSVAQHRIDAEERRPLLYVAIGCAIAGLVIAVVLKHPTIGALVALCGGGGAFAAWKSAEVPGWLWATGLFCAAIGYAFYTRGQWDANGNGIPDHLETK